MTHELVIWEEAYEQLFNELERNPDEDEIQMRFDKLKKEYDSQLMLWREGDHNL